MSEGQPPAPPPEGDDPSGSPPDPFAGLPLFGDLAKALSGQGPLNWDAARQFALMSATGGTPEANVSPEQRFAYGDLARIAALHVADVTGVNHELGPTGDAVRAVTRSQWATETLEAYRHLFTEMATALGRSDEPDDEDTPADPMMSMMAGLSRMMAPAMLGMSIGSMVGRLATRAFGSHDLPIPRQPSTVTLVPANIDDFAAQWEIPVDEMRLWVLSHEIAGATLFEAPHVREALSALVRQHAGGFRPDPSAISERLSSLEDATDPLEALQQALGDPELLLGAVSSPEQRQLRPRLDALVSVVVGYTDWVVDAVAVRLIGGNALRIAEAVRRQRMETSANDTFVEALLGIRLGEAQVNRGKAFVQGVVDRAGDDGLAPLLERPDAVPTVNEVDAPGLWLARLAG